MKRITTYKVMLTRERLANPYSHESLNERLVKSGAIDLRDNHIIEDLGNGYFKVIPKDPKKLITK